ncbi:unnamed protein product [Notodromas monacha]|uniref:mitogen-activated protein kinase kinase kinase n=1 Tax=Notodromas monacha TaxID=399045 RepID=A0A7R9BKK2_9CRUS|nr:unnamed protein product [Notodromas monacha]CAG0916359.1 unnamed protein product [Notodromas monacha]
MSDKSYPGSSVVESTPKKLPGRHAQYRIVMEVACVLDIQANPGKALARRKALDDVRNACNAVGAAFTHILFEKLDFGETNVLDTFYNSDVIIVDLSIPVQQSTLFYHLGVRESFEMKHNIILYNETDSALTESLKQLCGRYPFIPYAYNEAKGTCAVADTALRMATELNASQEVLPVKPFSLASKICGLLQDVEVQSKAHMKEKFLADLRQTREKYNAKDLQKALHNLRKRLDDPDLLSGDVVLNMLISFREIQDYEAMVQLVEDLKALPSHRNCTSTPAIIFLYAFALNRRKCKGDIEKALNIINKALENEENHVPDIVCLCGRINKDKFVESGYEDQEALQNAIHWYRKGFKVQPNEYAGVNLATLLRIAGNDFSTSSELQHVGLVLNNLIGRKGSLSSLKDYWDVATFFEISVLAEEHGKAVQAAECMFNLKPPGWYLKSTIGNITLISMFCKKPEEDLSRDEHLFNFWLEYFVEATKTSDQLSDTIRFPIVIKEANNELMPSHISVNLDDEEKSLQIFNLCVDHDERKCHLIHDFLFTANSIRGVSMYKRDERCLYLYVHQNSDDFQIFFPSEDSRSRFFELMQQMADDPDSSFPNLDAPLQDLPPISYEYDLDESGKKVLLGKGTYGEVYAARDLNTQVRIAVKEVPEINLGDVQPLHEEIRLHSQLRHKNIVQYLGSKSENGYFKIFMEQVPGGSLSALIRSKWGPMKENEGTIAFYTRQILEGLKYLHDQNIVHRDIKGDNVLVNTYSGVLKISDFGTSKRLAGICPSTETFTGTLQYMAPEVIDKGQRGYGPPADIWSLGCTIVEMASGKPPFIELGSPQAAMFKVGYHKSHPRIPEELSERAKKFISQCFIPNPDERPTAGDLLQDTFLELPGSRKKQQTNRLTTQNSLVEFNRSISVPGERVRVGLRASGETITRESSPALTDTLSVAENDLSREVTPPASVPNSSRGQNSARFPNVGGSPAPVSPDLGIWSMSSRRRSVERDSFSPRMLIGSPLSADVDDYYKRRASSGSRGEGVVLSPEIVDSNGNTSTATASLIHSGMTTPRTPTLSHVPGFRHRETSITSTIDGPKEQDGFYLLKKDSQRRTTLGRVLSQDEKRICEIWLSMIEDQVGEPLVSQENLQELMKSLKSFIADQNKQAIGDVVKSLKEELEYDGASINQLQIALYLFTEAVNVVLRSHSIKPHWMFALDNLMRTAVQAAIMVLSPDLGENLASSLAERKMSRWERQDSDSTFYNVAQEDSLASSSHTTGPYLMERSIQPPTHMTIPEEPANCVETADAVLKSPGSCDPGSLMDQDNVDMGTGSADGAGIRGNEAVLRLLRDQTQMRDELLSLRRENRTRPTDLNLYLCVNLTVEFSNIPDSLASVFLPVFLVFLAALFSDERVPFPVHLLSLLLKRLVDTEANMRDALMGIFEDQKKARARLTSMLNDSSQENARCGCWSGRREARDESNNNNLRIPVPGPDYADSGTGTVNSLASISGYHDLQDWLKSLGVDEASIQKFCSEAFVLNDVLELMEREDLRRLDLRGGMELRIWRAILDHRNREKQKEEEKKKKKLRLCRTARPRLRPQEKMSRRSLKKSSKKRNVISTKRLISGREISYPGNSNLTIAGMMIPIADVQF